MEALNNDKKVWAKPTVQSLNINNDTYGAAKQLTKEVGKGDSTNKEKTIPS